MTLNQLLNFLILIFWVIMILRTIRFREVVIYFEMYLFAHLALLKDIALKYDTIYEVTNIETEALRVIFEPKKYFNNFKRLSPYLWLSPAAAELMQGYIDRAPKRKFFDFKL